MGLLAAPLLPSQLARFHRERYAVIPNWLPPTEIAQLRADALTLDAGGHAVASLVGDAGGAQLENGEELRRSRSVGLFPPPPNDEGCVTTRAELIRSVRALRDQLQAAHHLALPRLEPFDIELKYLLYPVGGHFTRHLDAKRENDGWRLNGRSAADGGSFSGSAHRRVVSFILYLNEGWDAADGGALRVYPAYEDGRRGGLGKSAQHAEDVYPDGGTLVLVDSAAVEHAVLETRKERQCVVGWFREARAVPWVEPDRDAMSLRAKYWAADGAAHV